MRPQATRPADTAQQYSVQNLLAARQTGDAEVHSFGSVYGRKQDGDSVTTAQPTPPTPTNVIAHIDPALEPNSDKTPGNDRSYDAPSTGFTTASTRRNLCNEKATNANLLKENHELAAQLAGRDSGEDSCRTTASTRNQLADALRKLVIAEAEKQALLSAGQLISPDHQEKAPANEELTDTAADSVGQNA
jgi:hypothetical protein